MFTAAVGATVGYTRLSGARLVTYDEVLEQPKTPRDFLSAEARVTRETPCPS